MRKGLRMLLLAGVFAALMCTSALAAESGKGIHTLQTAAGYSAGAQTALDPAIVAEDTTIVDRDGGTKDVSLNAERVSFKVTSSENGKEYLIFVLSEGAEIPDANNIVYIDQQTGNGGELAFNLYPKSLNGVKKGTTNQFDQTFNICVSTTTSTGLDKAGSFHFYRSYIPGDVNNNKKIDLPDIMKSISHKIGASPLTDPNAIAAADVKNQNGSIDLADIMKLISFFVGAIDSLE